MSFQFLSYFPAHQYDFRLMQGAFIVHILLLVCIEIKMFVLITCLKINIEQFSRRMVEICTFLLRLLKDLNHSIHSTSEYTIAKHLVTHTFYMCLTNIKYTRNKVQQNGFR